MNDLRTDQLVRDYHSRMKKKAKQQYQAAASGHQSADSGKRVLFAWGRHFFFGT